jgi:hypothetical protein
METKLRYFKGPTCNESRLEPSTGFISSVHFYDRFTGEILLEYTMPDYRSTTYNHWHSFLPFDLHIFNWLSQWPNLDELPYRFKHDILYLIATRDLFPRTSKQELLSLLE